MGWRDYLGSNAAQCDTPLSFFLPDIASGTGYNSLTFSLLLISSDTGQIFLYYLNKLLPPPNQSWTAIEGTGGYRFANKGLKLAALGHVEKMLTKIK
jgi:hypothetical protein